LLFYASSGANRSTAITGQAKALPPDLTGNSFIAIFSKIIYFIVINE
jgi:hypothetical protein